jgi:hypothetical protein
MERQAVTVGVISRGFVCLVDRISKRIIHELHEITLSQGFCAKPSNTTSKLLATDEPRYK